MSSRITKFLKSDASQFVRPGPNRLLRAALPYVYGAGVENAPGSNQCCKVRGYATVPVTFGRLPVPLVVEVCNTGENGWPLCAVKMPLVCHPPRTISANPPRF